MLIVSVKDNKNNRWKRTAKNKKQKQKITGLSEEKKNKADRSYSKREINNFVKHLS